MTNLRHYQSLRERLQDRWREIMIPVQYEFYDPYAEDTENQEFECPGTETFLEQGDPLPPLIPGYSFYGDRGDEWVNGKGQTVSSIGCQTAMDDTVNEIELLQEQIQFKRQQNEYIDTIVNGQYDLMEYMEKEISRLNQYVAEHALKDIALDEKSPEQLKLEIVMQEDIDTARNMIDCERNLSRSIHRRTCSKCRLALEPQLLGTFTEPGIIKSLSQYRYLKSLRIRVTDIEDTVKGKGAKYPKYYAPSPAYEDVTMKMAREHQVYNLKLKKLREILSTKSPTALLRFKQKMEVFSERAKSHNNLNIP